MASFTPFPRLPFELRHQIWTLAIPEPESEVCIVWPLVLDRDGSGTWEEPALPLTVDTAWPAIMHACHEGRVAALGSGRLSLRVSDAAGGLAVPYRVFDPAIDTLYWGDSQTDAVRDFLVENHERGEPLGRALRHVAVEVRGLYPMGFLAEIVRQAAADLQTLSIVLPSTLSSRHRADLALLPPARRCRLRDVAPELCGEMTMARVPSFGREATPDTALAAFMDHLRDEMRRHVIAFGVGGPDGAAWSTENGGDFSGLAIKAQTFVEYDGAAAGGRWVEVCSDRMMDRELGRYHRPPRIAAADRRNPDEFRVIEDDCRFRQLPPPAPYGDFW